MATRTRGYALRADIDAPPSRVWTALTEPVILSRWLGPEVKMQQRKGGHFTVMLAPGLVREATIDVYDPPRRLRLMFQPPPTLPALEAVVIDDYMIGREDDLTVVRLLCSGVPEDDEWTAHFSQTRVSMERALARLRVLVEQQVRPTPKEEDS